MTDNNNDEGEVLGIGDDVPHDSEMTQSNDPVVLNPDPIGQGNMTNAAPPDLPDNVGLGMPGTGSGAEPASAPHRAAPQAPGRKIPTTWLIRGGLLALVLVGGWFFGRGETSAGSLDVGDCFELPVGTDDFSSVKDQECAGPHEGEIVAQVEAPTVDAAFDACFDAFEALGVDGSTLPNDVDLTLFGEERSNDYSCVLQSASGGLLRSYANG